MHLTDQELNEYLDNETVNRAEIEMHLDSCDECAARLSTLQALFADLDSLPEVTLSRDLAARFRLPEPDSTTPTLAHADSISASRCRAGRAYRRHSILLHHDSTNRNAILHHLALRNPIPLDIMARRLIQLPITNLPIYQSPNLPR